MSTRFIGVLVTVLSATILTAVSAAAQDDCDAACQAARNAQDPLAPVTAIFTDNTIGYGPNKENETHNYQLQGAHTLEFDQGNLILRGIIPFLGRPNDPNAAKDWGVGDTILQGFWVPSADPDTFKFGFGPQFSLNTRDKEFNGPGYGAGFAVVGFGFAGDLSYGGILGHLWAEDNFSATTIQPIVYYNMDLFGGSYVGYNNSLAYNWNSNKGEEAWTIPLGLTLGKTWPLANGGAFDASLGGYSIVVGREDANDSQFKFSFNYFFP